MKNNKKMTKSGAVGIPVEMRRAMGWQPGDRLTVEMKGNQIIVEAYKPRCIICSSDSSVVLFGKKYLCRNCIAGIKKVK